MTNSPKRGLSEVLSRITNKLQQDSVVGDTLHELRNLLNVDRVVLYYFYTQWKGQVTFEAISDNKYSIVGSTGPEECFNLEYAELYLAGRIKQTDNIETAAISECHRDFLRNLQVRSNLVAPVLNDGKLWGLLVAHQCHDVKMWQTKDVESIRQYSHNLASAQSISES
jgi:GAF domain-containing protein